MIEITEALDEAIESVEKLIELVEKAIDSDDTKLEGLLIIRPSLTFLTGALDCLQDCGLEELK